MNHHRRRLACLTGWALLMTAVSDNADAAPTDLDGTWAGDQLRLVVRQGLGQIETGCATARLDEPLRLDAQRRFRVSGSWLEHRAGPDLETQRPAAAAARFEGLVEGDRLTLTVRPAGAAPAQVFHLRRGAEIKIVRCLAG